jgi:squalene-associated FAD-dependent desaturase
MKPTSPDARVVVVGGGLAGLAAALDCADRGAQVTLLERRNRLGGLTWSFEHNGFWVDNGQHVFLRCCDEYLSFLERIGASGDFELPQRLDIPVVAPAERTGAAPRVGRLRRSDLPAPFHLASSLLRFPHLPLADRVVLGRAVAGLRRLRLDDPALDDQVFGEWLRARGQSEAAITAVWDLITVPTVNLRAADASLAMAAKVFQTGLLTDKSAADMGWSKVPLGRAHGDRATAALAKSGVQVRTGTRVLGIEADLRPGPGPSFCVRADTGALQADAVVVAVPHTEAAAILPDDALPARDRLVELGTSAIVDVHLVFDRPVTRWPLMAGCGSAVQWVFDRTASSGLETRPGGPQYLAVSLSAADDLVGRRPDDLIAWIQIELTRLLPPAGGARVLDSLVTKERQATFRARPGTGRLRPPQKTGWPGLAIAGAWTDTGWPATMEGAVRSGRAAARAVRSPDGRFSTTNEEVA